MTQELPLFPLNTVLFPGMTLPLHIFEPRYKLMFKQCVQDNTPFGVVLIREGQEVGKDAIPWEVGTSAYVTKVDELDDGRLNIQSIGYQRFKIHALLHNQPFLVGIVEQYPLTEEDPIPTQSLVDQMLPGLHKYLLALSEATDTNFSIEESSADSAALAYLMAIILPFSLEEKQQILETGTLIDMLKLEQRLLKRELMLLDFMRRNPPRPQNPDIPFSTS